MVLYLFHSLGHLCDLYKYEDDTSFSHCQQEITQLKLRLAMAVDIAVKWLRINNLQVNQS